MNIVLLFDGKHLKVDCGFGLDHSKSSDALLLRCSDALLLRCSDAEVGQDRAAVLTDRVPCLKAIVWFCYTFEEIVEEGKAISKKGKRDDEARWFFAGCFAMC